MAGHIARMKEGRSAFNSFTNKPYRKISLGRPRHRWEENIKKCLKEIQINTENWVDSAQDWGLLESPCECSIEPPGFISNGARKLDIKINTNSLFHLENPTFIREKHS